MKAALGEQANPTLVDIEVEVLRDPSHAEYDAAWERAYPVLVTAGGKVAGAELSGSQWAHAREDAVADAVIAVQMGLSKKTEYFNQARAFRDVTGMTMTITRYKCYSALRRQGRWGTVPWDEDLFSEIPAWSPPLEATELRAAVASLSPPLPVLLNEHFFEGLTYREIAMKYDMTFYEVQKRMLEGLAMLRDDLE